MNPFRFRMLEQARSVSTSARTLYEQTAAPERTAVNRARLLQRRHQELQVRELLKCIGDLDCALSALDHAVLDDPALFRERLSEAGRHKAHLDKLWRQTHRAAARAGAAVERLPRVS